ncbi:MAG: DUF1848 domain-containing protein [Nitrospinota bacterium]
MQIVSVSRRTDVPAFYAGWFLARWRAGKVSYRNPFGGALYEISLRRGDVLGLVFWSRNYRPFFPVLEEIEKAGVPFYGHFTLTGLPRVLETKVPGVEHAVETARRLAGRFGPQRWVWRYDPVVLSTVSGADFHRKRFERLSRALEGSMTRCVLSFMEPYRKVVRNAAALERRTGVRVISSSERERRSLARDLAAIARSWGISVEACCSDYLLTSDGGGRDGIAVLKARCVNADRFLGFDGKRDAAARTIARQPTREACGCSASRDVGAYDTCPHGCVYCYANASPETAQSNFRKMRRMSAGRFELAPPEGTAAAPSS